MSGRSNRALGGSRPSDHMSRRPGARVGSATEIAAGGEMSSHSGRASDGSRPADDTGRRPELPTGVGVDNQESRPGRDHPYGRHAVVHPAPEEGFAAIVPAARAIDLFERKRRPERCTMRSWPRSQGYPGPWQWREQQQGWR